MARLGDFRKLLATKFLAKEAQMIGKFLGYFEKPYSYVKLHWLLLGQLLEKLGYFYSNIWSHWTVMLVLIPKICSFISANPSSSIFF